MKTFLRKVEFLYNFLQKYGEIIYLVFLIISVCTLTILKISGTSAGVYHHLFYGDSTKDNALLFGEPKDIRSDEFTVATAWTVSQGYEDYAKVNPLYGISGQSFLFYDVPVKDFTLFFKPQNWGFLFFPIEQAFAFKWWLRAALFLYSAFLILLRISKHQVPFAIIGSLGLFFSPYIQWWYSVTMMDIVTCNFLLFECLIRLIRFKKEKELWIFGGLFAYLWIALIFLFYPPTQIVFGWLFVLLSAGFIWQERFQLNKSRVRSLLITLGGCGVAIAGMMTEFLIQYWPTIETIRNTAYPGQRTTTGGGYNLVFLLGNFFNMQLVNPGVSIPTFFWNNQSMASGFFLYALFLLPILFFIIFKEYQIKKQVDFWTAFLSLLFLLLLIWELFGAPPVLGRLLLIDSVPPIRVLLALGTLNIILIAWFLYHVNIPQSRTFYIVSIIVSIVLAFYYLGFSIYLKMNYSGFIYSNLKIIGIPILIGLTFFTLLRKKPVLFVSLLFIFSFISSYRVNPLYQGLGELNSGDLAKTIQGLHQSDQQNSRWILYDSPLMLNYLQANGIPALSATYYSPDLPLWRTLDPEGQYNDVYNRYARVLFRPDNVEKPRFVLTYRDAMSVYVDPCSKQLVDLNVKYQVFPYQVDYDCLSEVKQINYPKVQFYIYEVKSAGGSSSSQ